MFYLVLYISICILGGIYGTYLRKKNRKLSWSSSVQTMMLILLLFLMGWRLGANESVIKNIGTIGVTSFALTLFILAGSVMGVFLSRKIMRINKAGNQQ